MRSEHSNVWILGTVVDSVVSDLGYNLFGSEASLLVLQLIWASVGQRGQKVRDGSETKIIELVRVRESNRSSSSMTLFLTLVQNSSQPMAMQKLKRFAMGLSHLRPRKYAATKGVSENE